MALTPNYDIGELSPKIIITDRTGVEKYRYETSVTTSSVSPQQDFTLSELKVHAGSNTDYGYAVLKIDDRDIYLVEIDQAGIFLIKNVPEDVLGRMLATSCANILFPFAREAVSDIVTRGGFPQLLLTPVNFDALYDQQKKQASEQAAKNTTH